MKKTFMIILNDGSIKNLTIENLVRPEKCGNIAFTEWLKLNLDEYFGSQYSYYNIKSVQEVSERSTQLYIKHLEF
jgi:hypothetical protein